MDWVGQQLPMALVRVSVQLTISRLSLSFVTETAVRQMLLNQNRCGRTSQTRSVCIEKSQTKLHALSSHPILGSPTLVFHLEIGSNFAT